MQGSIDIARLSLNFIELFGQTGKGRVSRLAFPIGQISCQLFKLTGPMEVLGAASFPGRGILSNIWKLATEFLQYCAPPFGDITINYSGNSGYPIEIRELSPSGDYYILPTHLSGQRDILGVERTYQAYWGNFLHKFKQMLSPPFLKDKVLD